MNNVDKDNEIFTLLLNPMSSLAQGGFKVDMSGNQTVTYDIDFDALFQHRQNNYKSCRVRPSLATNSQANSTISSNINNINGIIIMTGVPSNHSLGVNGVYLGNVFARNAAVVGQTGSHYIAVFNLLNKYGSEMPIPIGKQRVQIQFLKFDNTPMTNIPDYYLTLQFVLIK